ncbi:transcriptional regulator, LysR family [Roseivivax lentus]|uniref:Transcriptional regulator, LysR family n=1 Tax=Roseivivax lentus TaxID=633194 RepID=A0A1N7P4F0_9RHOB|nr:LysR family transcriptional regulator [Roseivivax lentus]SIT05461.1 transcriptional regulator, LysR family [Roseivivax lentus]
MMLNHRELRIFLAIARAGSIIGAADRVGMTQPALSRSLRRLEEALGARLFDRHSSGMTLTRFGEALERHAERIEFETARVLDEFQMLNGATAGYVRVGLVPSAVTTLLEPTIAAVSAKAPKIQVQVIEGGGDAMIAAVANGRVDFALVGNISSDFLPDMIITPVFEEEVCVAARPEHPVFKKSQLSLADLATSRWVLPEKGNAIWIGFDSLFRRNGLEPPAPSVSTNSVHILKSMVASDDYLTMMTRVIFKSEEAQGSIRPIPLTQALWRREIVMVRSHRYSLSPAQKLFLSEMSQQIQSAQQA